MSSEFGSLYAVLVHISRNVVLSAVKPKAGREFWLQLPRKHHPALLEKLFLTLQNHI